MEFKSDIEVSLVQAVGDDWTIARSAWVSTGVAEGKTYEDMVKLLAEAIIAELRSTQVNVKPDKRWDAAIDLAEDVIRRHADPKGSDS